MSAVSLHWLQLILKVGFLLVDGDVLEKKGIYSKPICISQYSRTTCSHTVLF